MPEFLNKNNTVNLLGKSSYSIYLYHMPIIYFTNIFFSGVSFFIISIVVTIFFSLISFKFIEPIRKNIFLLKIFPKIIKYSFVLVLILISTIVFYKIEIRNIVYNSIVKINNFSNTYKIKDNKRSNRVLAKWELDQDKCIQKIENFKKLTYLNCIKEDEKNNDLFFLVGDSYGLHFINTLASIPIVKNLYYARLDNENFSASNDLDNIYNLLNSYNKLDDRFEKKIIISINYPPNLNKYKIQNFLDNFEKDIPFIFVAPHFIYESSVKCQPLNHNEPPKCNAYLDDTNNDKVLNILKELKNKNNIHIYDFTNKFCDEKNCLNQLSKQDKYVFTDNFSHLTKEFGEYLSFDFYDFLKKSEL